MDYLKRKFRAEFEILGLENSFTKNPSQFKLFAGTRSNSSSKPPTKLIYDFFRNSMFHVVGSANLELPQDTHTQLTIKMKADFQLNANFFALTQMVSELLGKKSVVLCTKMTISV